MHGGRWLCYAAADLAAVELATPSPSADAAHRLEHDRGGALMCRGIMLKSEAAVRCSSGLTVKALVHPLEGMHVCDAGGVMPQHNECHMYSG